MSEKQHFKVFARPELQSSSLVVAWSEDAGNLGPKVIGHLNRELEAQEFAELEPAGFFPLDGVSVEDGIARFPEGKFSWCRENNLVTFTGNRPASEWYEFLTSLLDIAEHLCNVRQIYTIGGMISADSHTTPRMLLAIANSPETRQQLSQYDVASGLDYETPPGQRPTLSSYLMWAANRRNIPGANLWVPVPFYLVSAEDPWACRKAAGFFATRFDLSINFTSLDEEVASQGEKIAQARNQVPEIDDCIGKLERNISLTEDESQKLANQVGQILRKR